MEKITHELLLLVKKGRFGIPWPLAWPWVVTHTNRQTDSQTAGSQRFGFNYIKCPIEAPAPDSGNIYGPLERSAKTLDLRGFEGARVPS